MILTFTKNGIISITKASSTFGLLIGDRIKSLTFSQKSSCIKRVMSIFTITINPTYKQHWASQAFIEGGFPTILKKSEKGVECFYSVHNLPYSPKLIASQPFFLAKYCENRIPTNIISNPREESSRKLIIYLETHKSISNE